MIEIDGTEGGGQLLRTSLTLAAVLDQPIEVTGIRGNRPEPGLNAQHLAGVHAFGDACNAAIEGATLGSEELVVEPRRPVGGEITVDIGTAGSVTLVFDTLLPLATELDSRLTLTVTGGTEVKWAPPLTTFESVTLPFYRQLGLNTFVERDRTGFYPVGGGRATLSMFASSVSTLTLVDRGDLKAVRIISLESRDLHDGNVARRQAARARQRLEEADLTVDEVTVTTAETDSTGSAISIGLEYEYTSAGFDALGEPGKPAEDVADEAVSAALDIHQRDSVAVDRHLADQLLVFLAIAGGELAIPAITEHVQTSCDLLESFGFTVHLERLDTHARVSIE